MECSLCGEQIKPGNEMVVAFEGLDDEICVPCHRDEYPKDEVKEF